MEDEYATWKSNSPFLYELLISHGLEWPSLCVSWIPSDQPASQSIVMATYTGGSESNFLLVADVDIPTTHTECMAPRLLFRLSIPHDGEVLPAEPIICVLFLPLK